MKAVVITDFATEPTLAELPVPSPGPGQLLVRLHAAGLNPLAPTRSTRWSTRTPPWR